MYLTFPRGTNPPDAFGNFFREITLDFEFTKFTTAKIQDHLRKLLATFGSPRRKVEPHLNPQPHLNPHLNPLTVSSLHEILPLCQTIYTLETDYHNHCSCPTETPLTR